MKDDTSDIRTQIANIVAEAIKGVSDVPFEEIPNDISIDELGLDSLSFSQMILDFETDFNDLSESAMDELMAAQTLGSLIDILVVSRQSAKVTS